MAHMDEAFGQLLQDLQPLLPRERLITDPLRTLAYGTDASFYRLIPKIVIKAETEAEVVTVLRHAHRHNIAVTFRAAGTSLSGQAISDSVLLIAGAFWQRHEILDKGARIRLQPGVIGAQANRCLAPYGRKIGPDPASINAAMIGGIAANNASGMCCGVAQNSYHTVASLRLILADGTVVDTADAASRQAFAGSHGALLERLASLAKKVHAQPALAERIRHKFKIKNTTGYSLNALVDYADPFDIMIHLMIGSEGTLGFISEIVYHTVIEHPFKASALMIFATIEAACRAATALRSAPVAAVELMDRTALAAVESKPGMPAVLQQLSADAAALLVETRAQDGPALAAQVAAVAAALGCTAKVPADSATEPTGGGSVWVLDSDATQFPIRFTADPQACAQLWNIRKGLFPSVGAVRRTGTTVIIEDVAFPIANLAPATVALRRLLDTHGYAEAIIFGHALEGNLHFVFTQDFGLPAQVARYSGFMQALCDLVVARFDGSLKAEHGTGRNMAPFVELEWGRDAYALMQEIKAIFDPKGLLNPGVILNPDADAHLRHLKALPPAHEVIDKCIECGFCEEACPSKNLTLTPRHRIVVQREIARLQAGGQEPARLAQLQQAYAYQGEQSCAADGMCALNCPVAINTGEHTKWLRALQMRGRRPQKVADAVARHFARVCEGLRLGLKTLHLVHRALGSEPLERLSGTLRRLSGDRLPQWNRYMPGGAPVLPRPVVDADNPLKVVYFPSCISRTMGPAAGDPRTESLVQVTHRVLTRAGFTIIHPPQVRHLCCGTPFESKGLHRQADEKAAELEKALWQATEQGRYPVLCDTSPCTERMRRTLDRRLQLFEPVEFIWTYLLPRLKVVPLPERVALHVTCSARKLGLEEMFLQVARACAAEVVVPERVGCCGFAGDRGFSYPELNRSALTHLRSAVAGVCREGYSNSRACEIGLSLHSGIYYRSILYLLERCTRRQP